MPGQEIHGLLKGRRGGKDVEEFFLRHLLLQHIDRLVEFPQPPAHLLDMISSTTPFAAATVFSISSYHAR